MLGRGGRGVDADRVVALAHPGDELLAPVADDVAKEAGVVLRPVVHLAAG